jgi:hypothetical protein
LSDIASIGAFASDRRGVLVLVLLGLVLMSITLPATTEVALTGRTDVGVRLDGQREVFRRGRFSLALTVTNHGPDAARSITCGVSEPSPGSVDAFHLDRPTRRELDDVDGHASRVFVVDRLGRGRSIPVRITGTASVPTPRQPFVVVRVYCAPRPVDRIQQNNSTGVAIRIR